VATVPRLTLEDFFAQAEGTGPKELSVILKADVQGTLEAVRDSLEQLSTDEVKAAMAGLLPPVRREKMIGRVEVLQTFTIPKIGTIAGSLVVEGKVLRAAHCRLVRDGVTVYEGKLSSLRRFKDDVREVASGSECGVGVANFNDVKVGDEIEILEVEEVAATL
jgi:translation initiation factor IF-2